MDNSEQFSLNKTIYLLWLQGWDNAPWLQKQVATSWIINNPSWKVELVDLDNLKTYVNDIDYIYDKNKSISHQHKADIIRLSLLKNLGGVWADSTMLCMQPLCHWVFEAVEPAGIWMYHGTGGGMTINVGPTIWFIISKKNNYCITKWKQECDDLWNNINSINEYFWLDGLFRKCFETDETFRNIWLKSPYLNCELDGQSHTLAHYGMNNNTPHIKYLFLNKPPYALKLWKHLTDLFPDINADNFKETNAYFAIEMSKRNFIYKHNWE
jgi:hypothetical protein